MSADVSCCYMLSYRVSVPFVKPHTPPERNQHVTHTLIDTATTYLVAIPNPITPTTEAPPGSTGFLKILSWVLWAAFLVCVAGMAKAGGYLAWAGIGRGGSGDGGGAMLGYAAIGAIITAVAGAIVTALAVAAG